MEKFASQIRSNGRRKLFAQLNSKKIIFRSINKQYLYRRSPGYDCSFNLFNFSIGF